MKVKIHELPKHPGLPGATCVITLPDTCSVSFSRSKSDEGQWGLRATYKPTEPDDTGSRVIMNPVGEKLESPAALLAWLEEHILDIRVDGETFWENDTVDVCVYADGDKPE